MALFKRWAAAFPPAYRDRVPARDAVPDVRKLDALSRRRAAGRWRCIPLGGERPGRAGPEGLSARRAAGAVGQPADARAHGRARDRRGQLPDRQRQGDAEPISLHDFELHAPLTGEFEPETLARLFEDAFAQVLRGEVESDDFNRLVLLAALAAEDIVVLRAYAKYLKQIGFAQSQATIAATLAAHPRIARMLVEPVQAALRSAAA